MKNSPKDVVIYDKIVGFRAIPRYIPDGLDPDTHGGFGALGPDKNQLPRDYNVTFFFDYITGTIETIEFQNTTDGAAHSEVFNVTDRFNAKDFRISIPFPDEGFHNVTIIARNKVQGPVLYHLFFEMVGKVKGAKIDDLQKVTSKDELKTFDVSFETAGAGTCMEVDYKDGVIESYGDFEYCEEWVPETKYNPSLPFVSSQQSITHVYVDFGI